jgi:small subunit ribosomal protein S16
MVKIRLKRHGRRHRAEYRLVITDARSPRDGAIIEEVGTYSPQTKDAARQFAVKAERVKYWLSVGAQPSETAHDLLAQAGLVKAAKQTPRNATKNAEYAAVVAASAKLQKEKEEAKAKAAKKAA